MTRQKHGVAGARVLSTTAIFDEQSVVVTDGAGEVLLAMSKTSAAGLTPEMAYNIADALVASADRVRKTKPK